MSLIWKNLVTETMGYNLMTASCLLKRQHLHVAIVPESNLNWTKFSCLGQEMNLVYESLNVWICQAVFVKCVRLCVFMLMTIREWICVGKFLCVS